MSNSAGMSMPARIVMKFAANVVLVWFLHVQFGSFFVISGEIHAWVVVGALLTLLNMLVRPVLHVLTFPLKLFATILAIIIVNGVLVQLTVSIVERMDPQVVTLSVQGGLLGWTIVAVVFGLGNWLMKASLK